MWIVEYSKNKDYSCVRSMNLKNECYFVEPAGYEASYDFKRVGIIPCEGLAQETKPVER
jgi:hypothetical protein